MNICFYTLFLPNPKIGGIERVTYNLSEYFRKLGIGVFNLTKFGDNPTSVIPQDISVGEKIEFINRFLKDNNVDILIDQYGDEPLLEHPHIPDKVKIINCYHLTPQSRHLCRRFLETFSLKKIKSSLFDLACILNTPRREYLFRKTLRRKTHGGVDRMVYLSPNYIPYVHKLSKAPLSAFGAIPNAAEDNLLHRAAASKVEKKKTIVWCGRIVHSQKNVLFLPRLWQKLEALHPDWNLIIVGDGIDRDLLERRIKKYKLKRVTVTGFTDSYPYYESASISITPSFYEGFPMVLIEAMAFGCVPVVYDNTASYSDIIESGRDGYIVPDMDEEAYFQICDCLMRDEPLRKAISDKAREKVGKFSIQNVSIQWQELFNELCKN